METLEPTQPVLSSVPAAPTVTKPKKPKRQTRADRWFEAVAEARKALDSMTAARDEVMTALAEVKSVQEEFEEWKDNLPENLSQSALGEKLEEVCGLDVEPDENAGVDDLEELISTLEGADLPRGFGRD